MERYFVHNLETDKLNIFTGGKSDWLTIPESDRDSIKRACLWSRSINGWVSRCKGGLSRFWAADALTRNGFEDRGTDGERLSFAEQVEAKQDRAEARAERFEDRADSAVERSNAHHKISTDMLSVIPMGQPILVGHHSEQRDRNYRDRAWNQLGKAVAESDKAKHYAGRAATARATAGGEQYSDPGYLERRIKECKAQIALLNLRLLGKSYSYSDAKEIGAEYRERITDLLERETDKLEFHQHCMETCGRVVYNRETLKGKQAVQIRGRWERIVKLNPTTVAVPNICFEGEAQDKYALKYGYGDVQNAR